MHGANSTRTRDGFELNITVYTDAQGGRDIIMGFAVTYTDTDTDTDNTGVFRECSNTCVVYVKDTGVRCCVCTMTKL